MSRALIHHHFVSQATGKYAIGLVIHNFRKLGLLTGFAHVFASTSPSVQLLFICAAWHALVCQERIAPPRHDRPLLLAMEVCSRCSASTPMPSCYAQLLLPAASRADLTGQSQHALPDAVPCCSQLCRLRLPDHRRHAFMNDDRSPTAYEKKRKENATPSRRFIKRI